MKRHICVFLLTVVIIVPAGCSGSSRHDAGGKAAVNDSVSRPGNKDGSFNVKDGRLEVTSSDGKSQLSAGEGDIPLPEGYPSGIVPIIVGGKVILASRSDENGKISFWISVISDRDSRDVFQYYEKVLKSLDQVKKTQREDFCSIGGVNSDNSITVTVLQEVNDGKRQSAVQIVIGPKE